MFSLRICERGTEGCSVRHPQRKTPEEVAYEIRYDATFHGKVDEPMVAAIIRRRDAETLRELAVELRGLASVMPNSAAVLRELADGYDARAEQYDEQRS